MTKKEKEEKEEQGENEILECAWNWTVSMIGCIRLDGLGWQQ